MDSDWNDSLRKNNPDVENIYKTLLVFDEFFDKMSKEDKRRILESLIAEEQLHPKETWKEGKKL